MMIRKYRAVVAVIFAAVIGCTGCGTANIPEQLKTEAETETQLSEKEIQIKDAVEKIKASVNEHYNDEFKKTELSQRISDKSLEYSETENDVCIGRFIIYIEDLITGENIKSIEYTLSNCVGSFMDDSCNMPSLATREAVLQNESKPYLLEGNDQSEVFFSVYYYYDTTKKINDQTTEVQGCIKHLRITADITFEDGSKETRNYGVGFISETSSALRALRFWQFE